MDLSSSDSIFTFIAIAAVAGTGYFFYNYKKNVANTLASDEKVSFLLNLTALAKEKKIQKVIGMENEASRMIHVLSRRHKSNPLLIGEPGVGKTAAVELLAQRIVNGEVPPNMKGVNLYALNLGELMAGTKYRGDLEKRLQKLLTDLEGRAKKNILFIDEMQMIEQARGVEGGLDLADIIKPALSRGELRVIGATTWKEYEEFLKPDSAIERRFQPVLVSEPTAEATATILKGVKDEYEKYHSVKIPDETIQAAVDSAIKYIQGRHLPDKALDVIDEACSKVAIENSAKNRANGISPDQEQDPENYPTVMPKDVAEIVNQWVEFHK